jgi:hypothetical protein
VFNEKFSLLELDMKDMGEGSYVLEIEFCKNRHKGVLELSQKSYIRSIMYAQIYIRPDLEFTIGMLGRYQINPGIEQC